MHLALINIARARYGLHDRRMAEFVDNLDEINEAAVNSPGFVWRLVDAVGSTSISINVSEDPRLIVNIAVWESVAALEKYTYQTSHIKFFSRRYEWFERLEGPHMALWWITPGTRPSLAEGLRRLSYLQDHGPGPEAFVFGNEFPPPG